MIARDTIDETIDRRLNEKEKNLLRLLEDHLPLGTFGIDEHQMVQSEDEEVIDFEETLKDLRQQFSLHAPDHIGKQSI